MRTKTGLDRIGRGAGQLGGPKALRYALRMPRYSAFRLVLNAIGGHRRWTRAWRDADPKSHYDVVVVGGGGHGLATAYYLARKHGVRNVAVLEKGWLGGGNTGRNTQVCRSNYFYPESAAFYEHSLRLYETLGRDLDFNIMLSQRGVLELSHSVDEFDINRRWANAMRMNGIDSEIMGREDIGRLVPELNLDARIPIVGGFIQRRGGIARHDAVAWAYARAASAEGVDLVQQCEVQSLDCRDKRIVAVQTNRGRITADRVALCVAGHSSHLARTAGLRLPITSIALQAMVTEPVEPLLHTVIASAAVHCYVSQSDRGEMVIGGGADPFASYAQRGVWQTAGANVSAVLELLPCLSRLKMMRQWAGVCDIAPDSSPIVGCTPIDNLYLSTGWGTGGFKAIPAGGDTLAHTIATGQPHDLLRPFGLERFETGRLVDEGAAAGVAH